jgi:hypothetical protein
MKIYRALCNLAGREYHIAKCIIPPWQRSGNLSPPPKIRDQNNFSLSLAAAPTYAANHQILHFLSQQTTTMAPTRTATVKNKHASKHAANGSGIKNSKFSTRPQNDGKNGITKTKKEPPKTKKGTGKPKIKKRRMYTEKELNIPALNMITPVGVEAPKRGKKGKVFVDDRVGSI